MSFPIFHKMLTCLFHFSLSHFSLCHFYFSKLHFSKFSFPKFSFPKPSFPKPPVPKFPFPKPPVPKPSFPKLPFPNLISSILILYLLPHSPFHHPPAPLSFSSFPIPSLFTLPFPPLLIILHLSNRKSQILKYTSLYILSSYSLSLTYSFFLPLLNILDMLY